MLENEVSLKTMFVVSMTLTIVRCRYLHHTCVSRVQQAYSNIPIVCCRYICHTCVSRVEQE